MISIALKSINRTYPVCPVCLEESRSESILGSAALATREE